MAPRPVKLLLLLFSCFFCKSGEGQNNTSDNIIYNKLFWSAISECRYDDALDYSEKYYATSIQKNDEDGIFSALNGMFVLNSESGNYEKAFEYAQKLYDIAIPSKNKIWIAKSLWSMADLYTSIEDYPAALNYYRRVNAMIDPEIKKALFPPDTASSYELAIAEVFSLSSQFDSAWYYFELAKPANAHGDPNYFQRIGETYLLQGKYQLALQQFRMSLTLQRDVHHLNELMRTLLSIARTYFILDQSSDAIPYGREGLRIAQQVRSNRYTRDGYQLLADAYQRQLLQDSSNYYFRKYIVFRDVILTDQAKGKIAAYGYDQHIALLNKEKQIQDIQLQKQALIRNILIGSFLLLLLFGMLFVRNIMLNRRDEARRRTLAENQLRIQKLETEKSMAELLQQQSALELKALRAQMNPHFIFNCLNSINRFIILHDAAKAADYLTKFAKLIRIVLETSGNAFIPLDDELNCLKLYMDLEALRFERPFAYEIHLSQIDTTSVLVPSLLIQPFVENAIWHGLHPATNGQGKIDISMWMENDLLHCEITDNGIGMKASAALKAHDPGDHKSFGIELTKHRLKLADPLHEALVGVSISDRKDEFGKNNGTKVLIRIPVKRI